MGGVATQKGHFLHGIQSNCDNVLPMYILVNVVQ